MITTEEIKNMLGARFRGAEIEVSDMTGTGDHFEIAIESAIFKGKPLIEQHKMVHEVLGPEMDKRIHAVQIKTKIPNS